MNPISPSQPSEVSTRAAPPLLGQYQAMCCLALGAVFLLQMQQNIPMFINAIMLVIGLLLIFGRVRYSPLYVLAALAAGQLIGQGLGRVSFVSLDDPFQRFEEIRFFDLGDMLLCVGMLAYLGGQYRLHGIRFDVVPPDERRLRDVPDAKTAQGRAEKTMTSEELLWLVIPMPLYAVIAQCGVVLLPQSASFVELQPGWVRLLTLTWIVFVMVLLAAYGFRLWRRFQMDAATARLLLQDVLWNETRREQRRINRWLAWRNLQRLEDVP